ncbi:hypothetical protein [Rhodococcus erythropolis]|uniref:hypothetical protein n=1 Tax=Rhodococcus erythropolis TaxID=1833 RepID=UPI003013B3B3
MTSGNTRRLDEIIGTVFDTEIVIATGKSTGIKRIRTISGGNLVAVDKDKYPHLNKDSFKQAILQWVNDEVIGEDYDVEHPQRFVAGEYAVTVGANYEKSQSRSILKQHGFKQEGYK